MLVASCAGGPVAAQVGDSAGNPVALIGGRLVDGTGSPPTEAATVVIQGDRIVAVGPDATIPEGATRIDVSGHTILPGLIDMHGHLYARATRDIRSQFEAYPQLYLAGGVTAVRSPGDLDPEGTIALRDRIRRREAVGPWIFTSGPYFDGHPSQVSWIEGVSGPAQALAQLEEWRGRIDGVKLYTSADEEIFAAVIGAAREAGLPTTAHLGAVTARRAIELGIGGLEHGIFAMPELPFERRSERRTCDLAELDLEVPAVSDLIDRLVEARVVFDPTIVTFQGMLPDFAPVAPDWERYLSGDARAHQARIAEAADAEADYGCFRGALEAQLRFVGRLHERGGIVVPGTDPVAVRLIPGYGLHRELSNLVDAGLTPVAAIRAATLDAAEALGEGAELGSVAVGKRADLVVVSGDPSRSIADVGRTEIVFQGGVRYDPAALRRSAEGRIR